MRTPAHKARIMRLAHDSTAEGCLPVAVVLGRRQGRLSPLPQTISATWRASLPAPPESPTSDCTRRAETRSSRGSGRPLPTIERSRPLGRDVPSFLLFVHIARLCAPFLELGPLKNCLCPVVPSNADAAGSNHYIWPFAARPSRQPTLLFGQLPASVISACPRT